ncbi:hypothetical protein PV-S19_0406 [Pacmanvirus S19]|nr:hypothetical protein PV-S19_0406 [Pacmanvirus S19]
MTGDFAPRFTQQQSTVAVTENGALSHATTGSAVLDLFFKTLRSSTEEQVNQMMSAAWQENPLLTLKAVFHLRDCRGGKGERKCFYYCIRWLIASGHARHVEKNLELVPHYGTYKDLLVSTAGTEIENAMLSLFAKTLSADVDKLNSALRAGDVNTNGHANVVTTLAGKWAPTEGGELDTKYKFVRKLCSLLKSNPPTTTKVTNFKEYRTNVIAPLRKHSQIVERDMCSNTWENINFSHVPSVAMKLYRKAFESHQSDRFKQYLADVSAGKSKINARMVFPHQLVSHYMRGGALDETIELQWKEIVRTTKKLFGDAGNSAFPLVDVSGSMIGQPMEVAVALGLLLTEIAHEPFRGTMLTFTEKPSLFSVNLNSTLKEKVDEIRKAPWGGSTNLAGSLELLLTTAKMFKVPAENMPRTLYIFSDMQFNEASPSNNKTNFQNIDVKYTLAGYRRPNIVFWNLRANTVDFPVEQHVPRTALVSGFSQSIMSVFMSGDIASPVSIMLDVLNSQRYELVQLAN